MKRYAVLLLLSFAGTTEAGTVCIGQVPHATSGTKSLANAAASPIPYEFSVKVGAQPEVQASHSASVLVAGLDEQQRHFVVIRQNGKPVSSFRFRFAEREAQNLCLWFGPLYESWSLWPMAESKGKCSCESSQT